MGMSEVSWRPSWGDMEAVGRQWASPANAPHHPPQNDLPPKSLWWDTRGSQPVPTAWPMSRSGNSTYICQVKGRMPGPGHPCMCLNTTEIGAVATPNLPWHPQVNQSGQSWAARGAESSLAECPSAPFAATRVSLQISTSCPKARSKADKTRTEVHQQSA